MFCKAEAQTHMFHYCIPVLLEFHQRVRKKNVSRHDGGINRSCMDMARISTPNINYHGLGHYRFLRGHSSPNQYLVYSPSPSHVFTSLSVLFASFKASTMLVRDICRDTSTCAQKKVIEIGSAFYSSTIFIPST